MGIWGMLPPFAARAEHRADGKGSPGAAMVKSRMLAVMLLCKSTAVTHVLHLLLFHKGVCCETTLAFNITFCGATVQGCLRVPSPALSHSTEQGWELWHPMVIRLEGTSGVTLPDLPLSRILFTTGQRFLISSHPPPRTLCCREHIWSTLDKFNCAMTCTCTDTLQQLGHKLCLLQEPSRTAQWEMSGSCGAASWMQQRRYKATASNQASSPNPLTSRFLCG